jgi:hypothetical protein
MPGDSDQKDIHQSAQGHILVGSCRHSTSIRQVSLCGRWILTKVAVSHGTGQVEPPDPRSRSSHRRH